MRNRCRKSVKAVTAKRPPHAPPLREQQPRVWRLPEGDGRLPEGDGVIRD